ncbi:hypothetical protein ACFQ4K_22630 [Tistrella bauzanensis]
MNDQITDVLLADAGDAALTPAGDAGDGAAPVAESISPWWTWSLNPQLMIRPTNDSRHQRRDRSLDGAACRKWLAPVARRDKLWSNDRLQASRLPEIHRHGHRRPRQARCHRRR